MYLVSGILGERCHIQFTAVCADIKKVKPTNSKDSAKEENKVLLLHDNSRPHTSVCTRDTTATVEYTVLPQPPYTH
jgi:hypothetical protein